MQLTRQGDGGEHQRGDEQASSLQCKQNRGKQKRDEPEQVTGRLADAIGRERKDDPADQCRTFAQPERA